MMPKMIMPRRILTTVTCFNLPSKLCGYPRLRFLPQNRQTLACALIVSAQLEHCFSLEFIATNWRR